MTRDSAVVAMWLAIGAIGAAIPIGIGIGDSNEAPPAPTTTVEPYCVGESLVIEGTGVVDFAPRCERPPEHAPPNTGPTTGPRGERRTP